MKKIYFMKAFLAAIIVALSIVELYAEDNGKNIVTKDEIERDEALETSSIRSDSEKAFMQLTSNSIDGLKDALRNKRRGIKGEETAKFRISEVQAPVQTTTTTTTTSSDGSTNTQTSTNTTTASANMGIKVWFELKDGTCVNPTKRQWNAREKFYIHVQAAVPIYVALYQNFPNSDPVSSQIYPDEKYKDSFKAIQPGQSTKLPVMFETDDDKKDEIMSMVVVRADWKGIQNGLTAQATSSVAANNGSTLVTAQINSTGAGTLKCMNERVVSKKELTQEITRDNVKDISDELVETITKSINDSASTAKFNIVGSKDSSSSQPNEVCFYMFSSGNIGQWQLTIKK